MFSRRENDKPLHLGLTPHCGLCGTAMRVGQACTSLLGIDRATRYDRCTAPFAYPKYGSFHGEWDAREVIADSRDSDNSGDSDDSDNVPMLCRNPECSKGTANLEAWTVHVDCRVLFARLSALGSGAKKADESRDRLWIAAAWQRPWRQAAWLWLDQPVDRQVAIGQLVAATQTEPDGEGVGDETSLRQILHSMQRLPPELIQIIHAMSPDSLIWRLASVLYRHNYTASCDSSHITLPLASIAAWERGGPASVLEKPVVSDKPVVRLTLDHRGLCMIGRLDGRPSAPQHRIVHNVAYVVVDAKDIQDATVHFRFGLARLELPHKIKGLHVWDTPCPPPLDECSMVLNNVLPAARFQTVPLDRADGITFIFEHSQIVDVHVHTSATPAAHSSVLSLDDNYLSWAYVPIAAGDRVLAVGARRCGTEVRDAELEVACIEEDMKADRADDWEEYDTQDDNPYRFYTMGFVFRFEKAGDVYVGPMIKAPQEDTVLASTPPITLVFSTLETSILSAAGAYTYQDGPSATSPKLPLPPLSPPLGDHHQVHLISTANDYMNQISTAPLDGIVHIRVFTDPVRGFDRGLLFFYANGGQRALGQCRVGGVDDVRDFEHPACLCISRNGYTHVVRRPAARVSHTQTWRVFHAQAADELEHTHVGDGDDEEDEENANVKKIGADSGYSVQNIWECIPLGKPGCGRLQLTFSSKSSRLEVLGDDEETRAWRRTRHVTSIQNFYRP